MNVALWSSQDSYLPQSPVTDSAASKAGDGESMGGRPSLFLRWFCLLLTLIVSLPGAVSGQLPTLEGEDLEAPAPAAPSQEPANTPALAELRDLEQLAEDSFAQDDLITAVALYRQLAERRTQTSEKTRIMMVVAWLQHQQGRPGQTLQTLTDVLLLDPDYTFRPEHYSPDFAPLFYDAQKRALQTREAEASTWVRKGSDLMRAQNYDDARKAFEKALELWPDQVKAIYNMALADYYQDRNQEALDGFERVLALASVNPQNVSTSLQALALTNQALLYMQQNQDIEAAEALGKATSLDPSNATAWLNLGIAQRRLDRPDAAADSFQKSWSLDSTNVDTGRNLARAYLDAGNPGAADNLLTDLTSRAPEDSGLQLYLGMARNALGDSGAAILAFEASLARDADNRGGWAVQAALQLAAILYLESDFHGTRRQAERVTRWSPEATNGWVYLGLAEQSLGNLAEAQNHLEAALRLAPTRPDIHNSLGSVLFERADYTAAEKSFKRALELAPDMADAHRNLTALNNVRSGKAKAVPGRRATTRPGTPRGNRPTNAGPPRPQDTVRPGLGMRFSEVDYASLGLQGVMVDKVYTGTAAAEAGVQPEDLLLKMDGKPIQSAAELRRYGASLPKGQILVIELLRDNRPATARIKVP